MGQRIDGATAIGNVREHDREFHFVAEEGLDLRRLLDDLSAADGRSERGHDAHPGHISLVDGERCISRGKLLSITSPGSRQTAVGSLGRCAMRSPQTHRRTRNRLRVAVAVFVYLGLLAVWQIDTIRAAPLAPLRAFILGVVCGAMTGLGFVVHQRWQRYLAGRT